MADNSGRMIRMKARYLAATFLWCAIIFWLSSQSEPPKATWWLFEIPGIDKVAHAGIYGILAGLVALGIRQLNEGVRRDVLFAVPVGFAILYGLSDEIHQIFVPHRTFELLDLLADGLGALVMTWFLCSFVWPVRTVGRARED